MEMLTEYLVPVIVGICLIVGYIVKNFTPADNRFIPAVVTLLGVAIAVWMNWPAVTPEIIFGGDCVDELARSHPGDHLRRCHLRPGLHRYAPAAQAVAGNRQQVS